MSAFDACLAIVLHEEGGFVNHPKDPGGITNLGVTAKTWSDWTGRVAQITDMKALSPATVAPLYRARYWNAVQGDNLPAGLNLAVFDFAVNAGPVRSAKFLQGCIGAAPDGKIGPATLARLQQWVGTHSLAEALADFMDARRDYYRSLSTFTTFGKGWLARCARVEAAAKGMIP